MGRWWRYKWITFHPSLTEEDEDRYIVRHYTLDRKELPNEWNMSNFYNGEYGLKSANNLRS